MNRSRSGGTVAAMMMMMMLMLMTIVMDVVSGFTIPEVPTASIVVHVRRKRDTFWDVWQVNSNLCPPSLCSPVAISEEEVEIDQSPSPQKKPRGTGGSVFYQGDIVLDEEVNRYVFPHLYKSHNQTRSKRATVRLRNRLWKDGQVPYVFSPKLSAQAKRVILRAFKHITQRTCITFRKREKSDAGYIRFISEPGCWSAIGHTGRKQLLSLGRGCENIGTAVHEIVHSLGVWHEQARKDRDRYIRILEENISDRFLEDFDKVSEEASTSRGYPYDYTSVMHYSRFAFTRNGKPTIEVIGEGRDLGLTLRQHDGLSTIDMAQLRNMYRCNLYTDTNETSCPDGWFKHDTNCYRFFERPKLAFKAASRKCLELNSHLVFIESQREDKFLADHWAREFPSVSRWRTGGLVVNGSMKWYREDSNPVDIDYSNWGKSQPSVFTSMALKRDRRTNGTQWVGVVSDNLRRLGSVNYPFICERRARRKCLKLRHQDGRDYRGKLDHTVDGYTCQKWSEHYPHTHNLTDPTLANSLSQNEDRDNVTQDSDGLGNHNFCRNPKKLRRGRPWCFTTKKNHEWQLCDISVCSNSGSGQDRKL